MAETRIDLSSAGVSLQYCVESTSGTRPTSGYTKIPGIKSIPDMNQAPSNLETTTLDETEYKTYIPGLKDPSGAMQFGANNSETFHTIWGNLVDAYENAAKTNKALWFAIVIPGLSKAFYFAGEPSPLGMSAIGVDAVLEISPYITVSKIEGWQAKPTDA